MGMIAEIHDVNISLNQKLKDKQERENKKALQNKYIDEITTDLQAIFYKLFNNNDIETAYKKAILEKEKNIDTLTNFIENLKDYYNGKYIYIYKQFDIVKDLNDNYYIILNKIKKEFETIEKIKNQDIINKLKEYIMQRFNNAPNKKDCYNLLQQKFYIDYAINDIIKDQQQQKILYNNYFKVLNECKKYYNGYIIEEKEKEKEYKEQKREMEKIKRRDKLITKYLINEILTGINRKSK